MECKWREKLVVLLLKNNKIKIKTSNNGVVFGSIYRIK